MHRMIAKIVGIVLLVAAIAASVGFNLWTLWQANQQANFQAGINACVKGLVEGVEKGDITLKDGDKEVTITKKQ